MPHNSEKTRLLEDGTANRYPITLKEKLTSCRWQIGYVASCTMACATLLRLNMSMVVVCMKTPNMTVTVVRNGTNVTLRDDYLDNYVNWDSSMEGLLLSGYYIGPVFTSLVFGAVARRLSVRRIGLGLMAVLTLTTVITPPLTFASPYLVLTTRIIIGLAMGGLEPCFVQILSNWAPLPERTQMMSLIESANSVGGIGNFLLSGIICSIPVLGGWPFVFYIFGGLTAIAMLLWMIVVYDKPGVHPWTTSAETDYINGHRSRDTDKPPEVPWMKMLTSPAVWACVLGYLTAGIIFMVLAVCLPLYIEQVLQFDVTTNGMVSALAFVGRFLGAAFFGYLSDWVFSKRWFSLTNIRRGCQASGLLGSVPLLIWTSYLGPPDRTLAVILITLYWFILTCMNSGFRVNPADIAPRFAGVINGMCVFLNSIVSLFVPLLVTSLTPNGTVDEWRVIFFGCVGVSVLGAVVFWVLVSGEEQEWAKDPAVAPNLVIGVTNDIKDGSNTHRDV